MSGKYVVHGGYVSSVNDGDLHYVNAVRLADLYQLPVGSWRPASRDGAVGYRTGSEADEVQHLYPQRHAADYDRIADELRKRRTGEDMK